jgi:SMC interacting uncharacterized protein involved in chromosome segregation
MEPRPLPGVPVDGMGGPTVDPTKNVLDLVEAAVKRLDDLAQERERAIQAQVHRLDDMRDTRIDGLHEVLVLDRIHAKETADIRADYEQKLREKETQRIDAIRAVDVAAVQRAAEVSTTQAQTLATQQQVTADTLRTQVQNVAVSQAQALAAALEHIQKDISELRKTQYEQQGQKQQMVENRTAVVQDRGSSQWAIALAVTVAFSVVGLIVTVAIFVFR